ncbi:immunoglobulin superfamily member 10-like [Solea senegalensis]|uniref:matrix-remodeling-associated protein 5 n=1 Tax=Solea senegalensis TaxID=28829 RepID=UPI001C41476B|nr:matrix-remodeling-associated protein 5 [Solea senegalensis]KAG7502967.1 immunoglobulin superfamily member 10-like [Solea senegalensis]
MKMDPAAVCFLHTLLVLMVLPPAASVSCPRPCSCPQPAELHCTFRSLAAIPAAVSKNVERMNLGFNSIKITDKSLAGLRRLELLMVHGNDMQSVPDGAFKDLVSLQMLKISYNKLKEINRHTLQGLRSLARLHLDHNQLEFIHPDAFQGLTSLRLLQLEGNQLQFLHPATFTTFTLMNQFHVSTLKHLFLSDNRLTSLPSKLVASMPQLENLYLHGNPWTCDCNMRWIHEWDKTLPGVLKCKKDRALPGGQLCPMCSSPRHLQEKELQAVENMVCSSPVISSPHRTSPPEDTESEVMTADTFREPFGSISLGLSDEHGNEVDLECSVGEPGEMTKINWEQMDQLLLASNITLSVDLECPVDREKYERLWRLIAYYSNVPAHLQRRAMLSKEPHPTYVYKQDSEKDALYYTGVKVNAMAQPDWLMQASADLQLNRLQSSAKTVKLILGLDLSQTVEVEQMQRQKRTWVLIESTNMTHKVSTAILGNPSQMDCKVHSSEQAVIQWILPEGSKVKAPFSSADNRVSVSNEGRLVIKSVSHTDAGIYYCIAKVHGDLAVLPFYLTVQETASSPPGEDALVSPTEVFVGNPISLPCSASGSPDAEITWILPNKSIVSIQDKSAQAFVHPNGTLHISQAHFSDSGHYKCIAINQHGVDTLAAKIAVIRRKGLIRPLRKFPVRPQSASGVNTQIKVLTDDTEASGDMEVNQKVSQVSRQDPVRRIPTGLAPGRRGIHPSRSTWRRPPVLGRPTVPHTEDRKPIVDNRRRINMSKRKIDREQWAHIFAKIRDRNGNVTSPPVRHTTESRLTEQTTQAQETTEGSSDDTTVEENESQDDLTITPTPVPHTQIKANKPNIQRQETDDMANHYNAHSTHKMTSNSQHTHITHTSVVPNTMQTPSSVPHTSHDRNLDPYSTSSSISSLPQTTSVPLHAVTVWQRETNSDSNSAFSQRQNHSKDTDVNGVKAVDWSKASERSENLAKPSVAASANNDRELSSSASQTIPSVDPVESDRSQEENGNSVSETAASRLHTQPQDTTLLTATAPTTALVPEPVAQLPPRLRHPNSRRRNGIRRRRPNKRRQKLNETPHFIASTPENAPLETVRTTASSKELKIEPLEVTTAKFNTTIPFTGSQAVSSGSLSHNENTVSRLNNEPTTKPPSRLTSPPKMKDSLHRSAKPLFNHTSVAPSFPTASPTVGHGKMSVQTALRLSESASLPRGFDTLTSTTQQIFTVSTFPLGRLLETQWASTTEQPDGSVPISGGSSVVFQTTTVQADVDDDQLNHHYAPTEKDGGKTLVKDSGMQLSLPPPPTASSASLIRNEVKTTTGYTSPGLPFEDDLEMKEVTTEKAKHPGGYYQTPSQSTLSSESKVDLLLKGTTDIVMVDAPVVSTTITSSPPEASSRPDAVTPSTDVSGVTVPSFTSATVEYSPKATTIQTPRITVNHSQDLQIKEIVTEADNHPTTQSPDHKMTSPALKLSRGQTVTQEATSAPAITTIQTNPFRERLQTSTQDVSTMHRLPGQGSIPRGKPRIMKSNSQTFTVKAETDAQLPCEAQGEPKPFLSWTKVASGASIAQNTKVHRFEVHPNGTLIIRKIQHIDGGQYLCTVQNQYGADNIVANLIVLSQHPRVLQPRSREITVHLGGKVDLECKVEGDPVPSVTWMLPNHVHITAASTGLSPQQRLAVLDNGTLRISQASYTDRGIYKCIGSNAVGAVSVSVHLQVSALHPVIQQIKTENITLSEGTNAYIHCTATGVPQPVVRWMTPDGIQLTASQFLTGRNLMVFPNGTLNIQKLGPGNVGKYVCSASNTVATSRRTVMLTARKNLSTSKASIISSSPKNTDVMYGNTLLLNCVAIGEPNPWIVWRTPSKKLADAQYSFDPRIKVFRNGTIAVRSVTDKDSGDYLCVARNKMGDDYVLLRVNVLTKAAKIEQKQQRSSQEVLYGGDLKVDCVASGLPNPEISWALPDGTMINPVKQRERVSGGRSRRYLVFDNGTLYFNDVGMPEEGDYTCYAENQLGKDEMKVSVKVKVATYPPKIQDKNQKTVRVFYGETSTIRCNAKGDPTPIITWISPTNKAISPALDKYQILDDGTLVVLKVQRSDGGNYTCMARNSAGHDHKVVRMEVMVTPPMINSIRETSSVKIAATQDQRKLVDCVAAGTPKPRIMWVLPGNVILPAPYYSNRMTVHQNGTLEIRSPKRTDSGQLTCIARNEGGEVRLVVNLDVKEVVEKPKIRGTKTESLSLTVGNTMTLNCSFEASTQPHVTWILPNGTPLLNGARFLKFFHRHDGSLVISNPSVGEAGMYRCLGRNSGGFVERTIRLSPGRKPEIINKYHSPVNVKIGERLLLHCLTSGEPLRLAWTLPSGVVLNRPQRAGRYSVLPNGTFAVQQASVYDRGSYVCRAANEYGSSLLPVTVTVIAYPPRITNGPPSVTYAKRGVAIQLNCAATGMPKVEVAWETPNKMRLAVSAQPRLFGNKYLQPQGSLIIQDPTPRDAGTYRCTARNAIGTDSKATFLNVF